MTISPSQIAPSRRGFSSSEIPRKRTPRQECACSHCRLPVPPGLVVEGAAEQFCCNGCRTVWSLLRENNLEGFYALREKLDAGSQPAQVSGEDFSELDDPAFHNRHVRNTTIARPERDESEAHHLPRQSQTTLLLEGLHCAACVWLIEKLPSLDPGVIDARVHFLDRTVTLRWDPEKTTLSAIARKLDRMGYAPHPCTDHLREELSRKATRTHLLRLAVAAACAGNAMLLAFALYGGLFSGMAAEHRTVLRYASALVGVVALAWPGAVFFQGAWRALRNRTPHMDVSLSLGLAAGGVMGLINTIRGAGEIYFDSLCMLVFVLLVGRFFQFCQQRRAAESVALLRNLTPRTAFRIVSASQRQRVPIDALEVHDLVEVSAGGVIPADGIVEMGHTSVDQSLLTGESLGVIVRPGSRVLAGTTNLTAVLRVRVSAVQRDTRIGKLMELVESLSVTKTPLVELANRVSGYFLRLVLLLAAVTLIFWWPAGPDKALEHTIALLIVACPCALGLATPLTIAVAQGRAARRSILIRCGEVFERLNRPGAIWLDKTGTVTQGQMVVQAWYGRRDIIPHVLSLERKVIHPLADCLVRALEHEVPSANRLSVQELVYQPGLGVRGLVEGKRICIGSKDFLRNLQINMSPESNWPIGQMIAQGWTPLCIGCDGQLAAVVAVGDSIRPDAATAVKRLRALHRNVGLLSGDNPDIVRQVASQLDIPPDWTKGAMLPEDKLALVREAPLGSNVVMVGDGVNDAAALAAASVGVAVHGGAEASLLAAPVYLGRPGLEPLVELIEGSRRVLWAVRIGLFVSLSYNLFAISLAVGGQITPLLAAVLMPISSLSVTLLAILQRTFRSSP